MSACNRKLRMGMVGGGEGAFIGAVHRAAALLDGQIELVCGAFSSDPQRARQAGEKLYLPPERVYTSYAQMIKAEAALPSGEQMDFVAVVTPNHLHWPVARLALENGFHVISDKPATLTLHEALALRRLVRDTGLVYALTHTYTGYPLVKEARTRIAAGELGAIRKVLVEYPQGWLASADQDGNKQAEWRLDAARAGISLCMGDIGVHAAHLAEYVTGQRIIATCADIDTLVPDRALDDDGTVLLRFEQGARGVLIASQICAGEENPLRLRVYGECGGLEWLQQEPNTLWLKWPDRPMEVLCTGGPGLGELALANTRIPAGHPEGYLEAFANLYRNFASQVRAYLAGEEADPVARDLPGVDDAVRGMAFIEHVIGTGRDQSKWRPLPSLEGDSTQ